jgi:hypothetical protein
VVAAAGPVSATVLDLTTAGASGVIGSAFFVQVPDQSTGTGIIDPFLRIQANNVEQGVNSDGPYTMDEKSGIFTRKMLVSDFGIVDLNGTPSIRFLLDINQTSPGHILSLDMLKIYVSPTATYNTLALLDANATKLYDMDAVGAADNWVKLDYDLNPGSGAGDMFAYLPYSTFAPHSTKYLYLYSRFGDNFGSDDGFEEWARVDITGTPPPSEVPEPTTLLLLGGGLLGGAMARRRKRG